jgi:peroxiredoxin
MKSNYFRSMCFAVAMALVSVLPTTMSAQLNIGDAAPSWTLQDLSGKTVQLSDFKGKVVILNFWATWCTPCREEIPSFIALQSKYSENGLVIVGVSMDQGGPAIVKAFADTQMINYPIVLGDPLIAASYGGIMILPTTFVIDRDGKITNIQEGFDDTTTFETELLPLLFAPKAE